MKVREIMTPNPATCDGSTRLDKVAQLMVEHDCGAIPVVKSADAGQPLGIVTDRDIVTRVVARGMNPAQTPASEAMTRSTVTVAPDADVDQARRLMKENQIRRLLVVEDGRRTVGIVAQADLALSVSDERTGDVVESISEPTEKASKPSRG